MSNLRILCIDDFYGEPQLLREKALSLAYSRPASHLPARRSTLTVVPAEMKQIVRSLLGVDLEKRTDSVNGCFQLMMQSDLKRSYVHADHKASWATIVYLSSSPTSLSEAQCGTLFYRHRLTGLSRFPIEEESKKLLKRLGMSFLELKALLKADAAQNDKWEITDQIALKFNRFILYDAKLFHKNGLTWGKNLRSARLTHNFFI